MSVLGIGHDIVVTSRIAGLASRGRLDRFARRILHPQHELPMLTGACPTTSTRILASTWAAKEALYKCLDETEQSNCRFNEWYRTKRNGRRIITSDDYARRNSAEEILLTISHDGDYTSAFAVRVLNKS